MLHKFLNRDMVNTNFFYVYDRDGWVQTDLGEALSESINEPELSGLQEETILMGFHQPELCTPVGGNTAGTATGDATASVAVGEAPRLPQMVAQRNLQLENERIAQYAPAKPFRRGL